MTLKLLENVETGSSILVTGGYLKLDLNDHGRTTTLKEGVDYTLSYSKNKAVTTDKPAEVKITGKGNYKESYQNNNKKGTAKVTVIGTGNYAGRKTINFKIKERSVDYKGPIKAGGTP